MRLLSISNNMKNNFPKIPFFFSIIFFLFSCTVFLFFYKAIESNEKESQKKEGEWQAETKRRDEIKALDRSVKLIELERAELETHFANNSDIVRFLDTIEGLAPRSGAKAEVTSVDPSEDHTELTINMKASGPFDTLYKFLTLLENSPYELEFVEMDIQRTASLDSEKPNSANDDWEALFKIKLLSFVK